MGMKVLKAKPEREINRDRLFHTKISYWLIIIAVLILLAIGIRNLSDSPEWSQWALLQAGLGFFAFFGLQIFGKRDIIQKEFNPIDLNTILKTVIIFTVISAVMTVLQGLLAISEIEIAFYFVFVSITEELFFRGLLLVPFRKAKTMGTKIIGVLIQAVLFTVFHVNYWGDTSKLIAVFFSGFTFGIFYVLWDNITANILAHFLWNVIQVGVVFIAF